MKFEEIGINLDGLYFTRFIEELVSGEYDKENAITKKSVFGDYYDGEEDNEFYF
jgi:hypothetical protein